jgi:uncharacterized peroxidase-related enzyme
MFNFPIHNSNSAPDKSRELLQQITANFGFAPNIFAVTAESAPTLAGLVAVNDAFANSSFTPQEQQIILMAASVENTCTYCVAGHTLMAGGAGLSEDVVDAIRTEQRSDQPRYAILGKLVSELMRSRGRVDEKTLSEFLEQGYSKAQFFELVLGVCVKTYTNYVSNALNLTLDDAFKPYHWERREA